MSLALPACVRDADAGLPDVYRRVAVPQELLGSSAARQRGAAAFREHCALCHGDRGDGQGVRREGLSTSPRDFTDPQWRRLATPRRVFFAIREGLAPSAMPSWKALPEQQAWDLTAFVLSLAEDR